MSSHDLVTLHETGTFTLQVKAHVDILDEVETKLDRLAAKFSRDIKTALSEQRHAPSEQGSLRVKSDNARSFYLQNAEELKKLKEHICTAAIGIQKADTGPEAGNVQAKRILLSRTGSLLMRLQDIQEHILNFVCGDGTNLLTNGSFKESRKSYLPTGLPSDFAAKYATSGEYWEGSGDQFLKLEIERHETLLAKYVEEGNPDMAGEHGREVGRLRAFVKQRELQSS